MSFAEAAARQLVQNHIKFAQEFADDSGDAEDDKHSKGRTLLKALGILGLGAGAIYGGSKLYPHVAQWAAQQGVNTDKAFQVPSKEDPNALSTVVRHGIHDAGRNLGYGAAAGTVTGGLATQIANNPKAAPVRAISKIMGFRDNTADAATRLKELVSKTKEDGKSGEGSAKDVKAPSLLSRIWNAGGPSVKPGHEGAVRAILEEADRAGVNGPAYLQKLHNALTASMSPEASKNPLLVRPSEALHGPGVPEAPKGWTPNFAGMDPQRAAALARSATNPSDFTPIDALPQVSRDAVSKIQSLHKALDAYSAAEGTPHKGPAADTVHAAMHNAAPAYAAIGDLAPAPKDSRGNTLPLKREDQLARAKLLEVTGKHLPVLQRDHPSITGSYSRPAVELLSKSIRPTIRGGLLGAGGTLGYEALPYLRQAISGVSPNDQ